MIRQPAQLSGRQAAAAATGPSIRLTRRACLGLGGLSLLGLSTADLQRFRTATAEEAVAAPHRRNACVFIFLFGGPSHIDLWDMKPRAPAEIRGEFQPIATRVPGVSVCEHLPHLAAGLDKVCLLRSMTHRMNVHGPACSEIYTGRPYFGNPVTDQALPEDWPSLSSLVMRFGRSRSGLPPSVVLPWYTQFAGQDRRIAGQTGGRMGEQWNPFLVEGDPAAPEFDVSGLRLPPEISQERFARRKALRRRLAAIEGPRPQSQAVRLMEHNLDSAAHLIERAQASAAFSLHREPDEVRDRYGRTTFGQSLLLARRLIEADIPLVTVNWNDETRSDKVSPHWDTHHDSFPRLRDTLCPLFDRSYAAFLSDLQERGLLERTLVVAVGEFGRTPRIGLVTQNGMTEQTGRDHWPHAFTALLAGGGVRGGQVYGGTDHRGAFVADRPVSPADLAATILHHLGVDPHLRYHDEFQQTQQPLCEGSPLLDLA